MNILCIGDVVGKVGRRVLKTALPAIQDEFEIDFTLANAENAAGGFGLTPPIVLELFGLKIDVLTSGNHIWDHPVIHPSLVSEPRLLRPLNYPPGLPGTGVWSGVSASGEKLNILNLQGRSFLKTIDCPFQAVEGVLAELSGFSKVTILDFHAEATAEKQAMGHFLKGRVSAVVGTHTHVQTADERVLGEDTAYITDLGMTGPHDSVIGMEISSSIERFLLQIPKRLSPARDEPRLNGVVISVDSTTGQADKIVRINRTVPL